MKRKEYLEKVAQLLKGFTKTQQDEIVEDYKQWFAENDKAIKKDFNSQHKGLRFFMVLSNILFIVSIIFCILSTDSTKMLLWEVAFLFSLILSAILRKSKSKQYDRYTNLLAVEFLKCRINTVYGGNIQLQYTARHTINVDLNFRAKTSQDRMNDYITSQKDVSKVLAFLGRLNTIESFRLLFFLLIPVVMLIPCVDLGILGEVNYYKLIESCKVFEHLEQLITKGEVDENYQHYLLIFFLVFALIIYVIYAIKFLKHLINSTTAESRYRPLVEQNIFLLGSKDNKKDNIFLFLLQQILQIIVRGGWLWIAMILYVTLSYPFAVLLNLNFGNISDISGIFECIKTLHTAVMDSEGINKLPLFLAGILFCLFYLMHLRKEIIKRNNPKFTAILELD